MSPEMGGVFKLTSGNDEHSELENCHLCIVNFPTSSMVIFHSYVELPEGKYDVFFVSCSATVPDLDASEFIAGYE